MSRTFLATLHFDGTGFVGWQRQPAGRSVQVEFERVLERLFDRRAVAHAAGRTDAGVHAAGLAVSFSAPAILERRRAPPRAQRPPAQRLLGRVGASDAARLPRPQERDLAPVPLRHRYRRRGGTRRSAGTFEWALGRPLDLAALRAAATLLLGEHDFRAFAAKGEPKPHYRCRSRAPTGKRGPTVEG